MNTILMQIYSNTFIKMTLIDLNTNVGPHIDVTWIDKATNQPMLLQSQMHVEGAEHRVINSSMVRAHSVR